MAKKTRNPNGTGTYKVKKDGRCEWRIRRDGKEKYLSAKSMKELKQKVDRVSPLPIQNTKLKTGEWFDKWLESYVKPLKKEATYNQYRDIYRKHIEPEIGHLKLTNVQSYDIQGVIAKMNQKGLSTWTMKHARKVMHIAFQKAKKDRLIPVSPVDEIEIPKKQAKPRKTLTTDELAKLFEAMKNSRWIWSVKFMLITGLRRGELLALRWSDMDYNNGIIIVDESNSKTGIGETKSAKVHNIPLTNKAKFYLERQKQMLKDEFNKSLQKEGCRVDKQFFKEDSLVFPNESGEMLNPNSYYTLVSRFSEKAGIKASPHCLRHTFVNMVKNVLLLKQIQDLLGHDEYTTTTDIYGDMVGSTIAESKDKIDKVFEDIDSIKTEDKKDGKIVQFRRVK